MGKYMNKCKNDKVCSVFLGFPIFKVTLPKLLYTVGIGLFQKYFLFFSEGEKNIEKIKVKTSNM